LPSERDLAKHLGASRPSLREALLVLESRGLLQARRGSGFGITDVADPTITDPLVDLRQRRPETVHDVFELRHGLEYVAAYYAAIRATDEDARRLKEVATTLKRRRAGREALEDAAASHNVALVHVMRGVFNLMCSNVMRSREVLCGQAENMLLLGDQHTAIVKDVIARNHEAARAAANLHPSFNMHLSFIQASLRQTAPAALRRVTRADR
jgi:GntR family transcriptional repressor for pyruvate dehydrogenase complex